MAGWLAGEADFRGMFDINFVLLKTTTEYAYLREERLRRKVRHQETW